MNSLKFRLSEYGIIIGPWSSDDTTAGGMGGWDAIASVTLQCPLVLNDSQVNPARHLGVFGGVATAHRLVHTNDSAIGPNAAADVIYDGIQKNQTGTDNGFSPSNCANITLRSCILKGSAGADRAISSGCAGVTKTENCVVFLRLQTQTFVFQNHLDEGILQYTG